ncbi:MULTISPECIES: hypothetical protein [Priestia]|uniref:hypothetical protein n=1 Tax=Priestia TaxID=2800373 RepID=UPI000D3E058C|nr:hypothetical protein [Priestia megaterium]AWD68541.1 hypothetical protein C2I28_26265 [Priestia megaterium]AWD68561.1 hypothetical protein C2I28_26365 [Priestia megaterium]AWD68700.1 hypothetical protein C2I28_27115 [Priestia megaterium]AWD68726.1 hypothetical protein C2I28_27215 [Priestia megaterium]
MLSVMFIKSETKELKPFQKLSIPEACEITETVETQYRRTRKKAHADFFILDEEDQEVYAGTLSIGSGHARHVVDHIKKKLSSLKMDDIQEARKRSFVEQLEKEVPDHLKTTDGSFSLEEEKENHMQTTQTPVLSIRNRRLIYGGGILSLLILSATCFSTVATSQDRAETIQGLQKQVKLEQKITGTYERALLGDSEGALKQLSSIDQQSLTKEQKNVYMSLLVDQKKYKEAVKLQGNHPEVVESVISKKGDVQALKEFQQTFPSPNGAFDLAYHEQRWEDMMSQSGVDMTDKRYEMKAYGYLKLDKVKEAKEEAAHIQNQKLNQKIETYEKTKKEIEETKKQVDEENKKEKKDENKIKSLTDQQKKQEELLKNL